MSDLKEFLETADETLTIIVDKQNGLMSIAFGEVSESYEAWVAFSEEDVELLKAHASKIYPLNGRYYYVVFPKH